MSPGNVSYRIVRYPTFPDYQIHESGNLQLLRTIFSIKTLNPTATLRAKDGMYDTHKRTRWLGQLLRL